MADPNLVIGMNSSDYFWYSIWRLVAVVFVALIACVSGYNSARDFYILQSIKLGVPVEDVKCAFYTDTQNVIACAAKQKK